MTSRPLKWAKCLVHPLIFVLALVLVFEEWLWDSLKAQLHRLSALPVVAAVEQRLRRLPSWAALLVMLVPGCVLFPFKLAALYLLGHGHPLLGMVVLLAAKLTGTALAAYLFDLVRESARKIRWFDALYTRVMALLSAAKRWIHATATYRKAHDSVQRCKAWLRERRAQGGRWSRKLKAAKVLARKG